MKNGTNYGDHMSETLAQPESWLWHLIGSVQPWVVA
jgi:hypothetical protein